MTHFLKKSSKKAFTIIELMIAILVFTFGLLSAYMLVDSALGAAINGKNEIIAANLAREQIELMKNLRDTNWLQNREYLGTGAINKSDENENNLNIELDPIGMNEIGEGYYLIEWRDGGPNSPTLYLKKLSAGFVWIPWTKPDLAPVKLCLVWGRYTHVGCSASATSGFSSFIRIEKLGIGETLGTAYRLSSVVMTTQKGYREYVVRTIITDWKR